MQGPPYACGSRWANELHACPERRNRGFVRGVTADQHGRGIADIAYIFMGRGELLHHVRHQSLELGHTFLRLGHSLHHGADGFLRRQSLNRVLHRVDKLGFHRAQVSLSGWLAHLVVIPLCHMSSSIAGLAGVSMASGNGGVCHTGGNQHKKSPAP